MTDGAPEPDRPRRRLRLGRALGRALVWAVLGSLLAAALVAFLGYVRYTQPGPLPAARAVVIARGLGTEALARRLVEAGVLAEPHVFVVMARLTAVQGALKAGEFEFPAQVSPAGVIEILRAGRTVVRRLTVAEGLTVAQVMALVQSTEGLEGELPAIPAEGQLFPETYFFSWGETKSRMVERLRQAMADALARLWAARAPNLPLRTPAEAVVLASIVEKETARDDERPRVAAVFLNRLKRGMRLQADPTVVYGLARGEGPLGRPLSKADLETPHPWNTYVIEGLPPSPIANPGRAALAAVLSPATSDALYFVADGDGGHLFASTLAEHNRNVQQLRRLESGRARSP